MWSPTRCCASGLRAAHFKRTRQAWLSRQLASPHRPYGADGVTETPTSFSPPLLDYAREFGERALGLAEIGELANHVSSSSIAMNNPASCSPISYSWQMFG